MQMQPRRGPGMHRFVAALFALLMNSALGAKPNIIIMLADDLGYGDLSVQGHPVIRTPNIDNLAREGQRWTSFYSSAPVCGPSRVGLMTGRMTYRMTRSGKNSWIFSLSSTEFTLGEMLKSQGYATAYIGKWGLSPIGPYEHDRATHGSYGNKLKIEYYEDTHPNDQGFDYFFGLAGSNDAPTPEGFKRTYENIKNSTNTTFPIPLYQQREIVENPVNQATLTKRYTGESISWIKSHSKKPFFLFLAYNAPHVPIFPSRRFEGHSSSGRYGDVVEEMDWSVGQIIETLRKERISENTLIFFSSDNGPWLTYFDLGGSPGPFRDGKFTNWEGGFRVPGIFWWPGKITPGVVNGLGANVDIMKTLASIVGYTLPKNMILDSIDLSPTILKSEPSAREEWFFYGSNGELGAVRVGDYKLVLESWDSAGFEEQFCRGYKNHIFHDPPLLFDVNADVSERHNIAEKNPGIVSQILRKADLHRKSVISEQKHSPDEIGDMLGCNSPS